MDAALLSASTTAPCRHQQQQHRLRLLLLPSAAPPRAGTRSSKSAAAAGVRGRVRVNSLFGDGGGSGGGGGDGFRAVRRLVKLNSAVQNRSVRELLELAGDECLYFFGRISSIDISQMSKNMFLLLHAMMLRHHVSFVLKPTENEGFDLGVKWSLEWKGKKLPWDLDCNITTNHVYRGMLLINEVNNNLDAVILTLANKLLPEGTLDESNRRTMVACAIIGLVVMVVFYNMFKNL
uniref:Uncharacterized protein n=1 Tax=Oryza meridionalis TaxID=40149 RepID=A0A0E0EN51_9ORYZ